MSAEPQPNGEAQPHRRNWWVLLLMAVPLVAVLVPYFYNYSKPALGGFPFFYWWQLVWIVGVAVCIGIVYRITRRAR